MEGRHHRRPLIPHPPADTAACVAERFSGCPWRTFAISAIRNPVCLERNLFETFVAVLSLHAYRTVGRRIAGGCPSVDTIQVVFDAAFLLFTRRQFAKEPSGFCRWVLCDSSPQAGRDWFQCKEIRARRCDLGRLATAVNTLILGEGDESEANAVIASCLTEHMRVPMAKAEGHSAVEHLASCFVQAAFWETGP
jgi:hypothetical protein